MASWIRVTFVIALNTFRGFSRDRIFHATLLLAVGLIAFSYAISALTMVESQKILLDFGLAAISLSGVLIAIFLGTSAVSREIESKAIYTVLSKPISRASYLAGKYLGSALVVLTAALIMALTLAAIVGATGFGLPRGFFACCYFMALESLLILAVALFSSIFSSSVMATTFTLALFLIGRSAYAFHAASERAQDRLARALLRFLYDVLPNLDRFNIRDVTAYSKPFPETMLYTSTIYGLAYIGCFLALSVLLFQRKDMP